MNETNETVFFRAVCEAGGKYRGQGADATAALGHSPQSGSHGERLSRRGLFYPPYESDNYT
jgi:hypothetical protein